MSCLRLSTWNIYRWLACLILAFAASGCTTVKLVGDYDEQIDKGTTALQKEVETFLVKLESSVAKSEDKVEPFQKNKQFYADTKIAISGLRLRADATERNSLTVRMLDKLSENVDLMEKMHSSELLREEVSILRGGFTTQFTAILTFELAKKRGEKPNEGKAVAASTPILTSTGAQK